MQIEETSEENQGYAMSAKLLRRALLGHAVDVSLELGINQMRRAFDDKNEPRLASGFTKDAETTYKFLSDEIVFHQDHASWITAHRTSAPKKNILLTLKMLQEGRIFDAIPESYEHLRDGRTRVRFASHSKADIPKELNFDDFYNCTGPKDDVPENGLTTTLLKHGYLSKHFTGKGFAVDQYGRAIPRNPGPPMPLYLLGPFLEGASLFHPNVEVPSLAPIFAKAAPNINNCAFIMAKHLAHMVRNEHTISGIGTVNTWYDSDEQQRIFKISDSQFSDDREKIFEFGERTERLKAEHKTLLLDAARKHKEVEYSIIDGRLNSVTSTPNSRDSSRPSSSRGR